MSQCSTIVRVGLDVHASQTHAAVLDPASGEVWTRRLQGAPRVALDLLASLGGGATAVYEAGPSGFALARAAAERPAAVWLEPLPLRLVDGESEVRPLAAA